MCLKMKYSELFDLVEIALIFAFMGHFILSSEFSHAFIMTFILDVKICYLIRDYYE